MPKRCCGSLISCGIGTSDSGRKKRSQRNNNAQVYKPYKIRIPEEMEGLYCSPRIMGPGLGRWGIAPGLECDSALMEEYANTIYMHGFVAGVADRFSANPALREAK